MVEHVERLGSELKIDPFVHRNGFEESHVPVLKAGTVDKVANALRVDCAVSRLPKDVGAVGILRGEILTARSEGADNSGIADHVPKLAAAAAAEIGVRPDSCVVV